MKCSGVYLAFLLLLSPLGFATGAHVEGEDPAEPAAVALGYLEKIANQSLDLAVGADTAISRHVSEAKRREIEGRIQRMALDLAGGELEAGEVRVDGNLAGVIIHKVGGFNPESIGAFAVALVRAGENWLPAPLPASFENTGVTLDIEVRQRATSLEFWMLRQRALMLDELRNNLADRVRREIAMNLKRSDLETMTVPEVAQAFLQAAAQRDSLRLLGMLGGLSDPLPEDWPQRLRGIEHAMADLEKAPPGWRGVAAPEVVRAIVHEEAGVRDGLFSVAYIDPAGEVPRGGVPPVQLIHIDMERDAGGAWRINLPDAFGEDPDGWRDLTEEGNPFDSILFDAFPARLRRAHPASPQAQAETLWRRLSEAIALDTPNELLRMLALPLDDPKMARRALGRVLRFWWQIRMADGGRVLIPLAYEEHGDQALAMAQVFTYRDPESTDLRMFHMIQSENGRWMWQSTGRNEPTVALHADLATWRDEQRNRYIHSWQDVMLAPVVKLEALTAGRPVDEADAKTAVAGLLDAIAAGDLARSLDHIAVLDDAEGRTRLLRNLGYELSVRLPGPQGELAVHTGTHWAAVACRRKGDVNPGMAFFPVVATEAGPRVLLELDLFVGTRRRDFLNNVALERLDGFADAEVRADLRGLLQNVGRE